ncbi:hypothetical protein Zmor_016274 [Zophobas morio]|uniref:Uncharacterized protein n=1 Tax=Zophobas morio TaxID=2755281 RepID=A0AA38MIB8_9CUCU|nr:hypothetical protein Zmor_016274 [Zophobas morio]
MTQPSSNLPATVRDTREIRSRSRPRETHNRSMPPGRFGKVRATSGRRAINEIFIVMANRCGQSGSLRAIIHVAGTRGPSTDTDNDKRSRKIQRNCALIGIMQQYATSSLSLFVVVSSASGHRGFLAAKTEVADYSK